MNVLYFQGLDFVFLLAFVIGFLALQRLAFVKEEGVVTEEIDAEHLAQELATEIKGIASVAGLRRLRTWPIPLGQAGGRANSNKKSKGQ